MIFAGHRLWVICHSECRLDKHCGLVSPCLNVFISNFTGVNYAIADGKIFQLRTGCLP